MKPTPAALRAALMLRGTTFSGSSEEMLKQSAAIIERETLVGEMAECLRRLTEYVRGVAAVITVHGACTIEQQGELLTRTSEAESLLDRVEGSK